MIVSDSPQAAHRRSATAERRGELHAALVDAAEQIVATDGIEAVRARALARAAGCSVGAIYNVVPDLDALILEVNARTLAAIEAALDAVSGGAGTTGAGAAPGPAGQLVGLALAYLDYAAAHPASWSALFAHRMTGGAAVPGWYVARQATLFRHVEAPLAVLRPDLAADERALLARSLFSAVHGIVSLGLSGTLVSLPLAVQRAQVAMVVEAVVRGMAA